MSLSGKHRPTSAERHDWICRVVDQALDLPAAARDVYLDEVCRDADLRSEVDRLLAMDSRLEPDTGFRTNGSATRVGDIFGYLERLAKDGAAEGAERESVVGHLSTEASLPEFPEQLGGYRILDLLGSGGMGLVFLARQDEPIQRTVAIKVIRTHLRGAYHQALFDSERQALARLSHPNVAQLFDAGRSEEGFPFFVMEYLPAAETLTQYCRERELSVEQRLGLFMQVCQGVQHAHQKGILHRDLKPSNVLVVEPEGDATTGPLPKIIDFGLATALDEAPIPESPFAQASVSPTRAAKVQRIAGTPKYMSPEASSAGTQIDIRSDVFSLGVMLHDLLSEHRPRDSASPGSPQEPSGELGYIVRKATAPDLGQRYASVSDLTADLQRHLSDHPVVARLSTLGGVRARVYEGAKLVRRHRASVLTVLLAMVLLSGGFIARTLEAERARAESEKARLALAESEELSNFLVQLFSEADPTRDETGSLTVRQLMDRGARNLDLRFEDQPLTRARLQSLLGSIYNSLAQYDVAEPMLNEAWKVQAEQLEPGHDDRSTTLGRLGQVDLNLGRFESAKDRFGRLLTLCDESVGRQSLCAASALRALGQVAKGLGSIDEAQRRIRAALHIQRSILDPSDAALGQTTSALGFLEFERGRYESAEKLYLETLRIYGKSFPPDHPNQALIRSNLGSLYWKLERLEEAEALFLEAARIEEQALGSHRRLADTLGNLALVYRRQERFDEAEDAMTRALTIRRELLGDHHPDIAISLNNIGVFYWTLERYAEAESLYRQALSIQEEALEPGHFHIGHTATNLGLSLWKQNRPQEAEEHLRRSLELWEQSLGLEHPALVWPLWGLAGVSRDQGRLREAEAHYQRTMALRRQHDLGDKPPMADAIADYADLLRATGQPQQAEEIENG